MVERFLVFWREAAQCHTGALNCHHLLCSLTDALLPFAVILRHGITTPFSSIPPSLNFFFASICINFSLSFYSLSDLIESVHRSGFEATYFWHPGPFSAPQIPSLRIRLNQPISDWSPRCFVLFLPPNFDPPPFLTISPIVFSSFRIRSGGRVEEGEGWGRRCNKRSAVNVMKQQSQWGWVKKIRKW